MVYAGITNQVHAHDSHTEPNPNLPLNPEPTLFLTLTLTGIPGQAAYDSARTILLKMGVYFQVRTAGAAGAAAAAAAGGGADCAIAPPA